MLLRRIRFSRLALTLFLSIWDSKRVCLALRFLPHRFRRLRRLLANARTSMRLALRLLSRLRLFTHALFSLSLFSITLFSLSLFTFALRRARLLRRCFRARGNRTCSILCQLSGLFGRRGSFFDLASGVFPRRSSRFARLAGSLARRRV